MHQGNVQLTRQFAAHDVWAYTTLRLWVEDDGGTRVSVYDSKAEVDTHLWFDPMQKKTVDVRVDCMPIVLKPNRRAGCRSMRSSILGFRIIGSVSSLRVL